MADFRVHLFWDLGRYRESMSNVSRDADSFKGSNWSCLFLHYCLLYKKRQSCVICTVKSINAFVFSAYVGECSSQRKNEYRNKLCYNFPQIILWEIEMHKFKIQFLVSINTCRLWCYDCAILIFVKRIHATKSEV